MICELFSPHSKIKLFVVRVLSQSPLEQHCLFQLITFFLCLKVYLIILNKDIEWKIHSQDLPCTASYRCKIGNLNQNKGEAARLRAAAVTQGTHSAQTYVLKLNFSLVIICARSPSGGRLHIRWASDGKRWKSRWKQCK